MFTIRDDLKFGGFYGRKKVPHNKLKFAVIAAVYQNKLVFVKHKERSTLELPGGKREFNENIDDAAARELIEETGALSFALYPVKVYGIKNEHTGEYFGKLYFADIRELGHLPNKEIGEVVLLDKVPSDLTYPHIQPHLSAKINEFLNQTKEINIPSRF